MSVGAVRAERRRTWSLWPNWSLRDGRGEQESARVRRSEKGGRETKGGRTSRRRSCPARPRLGRRPSPGPSSLWRESWRISSASPGNPVPAQEGSRRTVRDDRARRPAVGGPVGAERAGVERAAEAARPAARVGRRAVVGRAVADEDEGDVVGRGRRPAEGRVGRGEGRGEDGRRGREEGEAGGGEHVDEGVEEGDGERLPFASSKWVPRAARTPGDGRLGLTRDAASAQ